MPEKDDKIIYIGDYKFVIVTKEKTLNVGQNLTNMIGYLYFEDGEEPEIGWYVKYGDMHLDYHKKVMQDIVDGKFERIDNKDEDDTSS